jgi:flagellar hook-associated protein 1 FlgK
MASSLNKATADVQAARLEADNQIAASVDRINDLLAKFEIANNEVMKGAALGADISDSLDVRDSLISQLSEEMGVTVVHRAGEDIALYTDSGVPLFDRSPRTVSFVPTNVYAAGTTGNAVFVDGVQVTGAGSPMPLNSGTIVGLAKLRDEAAVTYQKQLDEIARGLIEAFAEVNTSDPTDKMPGVFTYATVPPAVPSVPAMPGFTGLAGRIKINSLIDPSTNPLGKYDYIRDGGLNGGAYTYNTDPAGNAAFSDRLNTLVSEMKESRPFDSTLGLGDEVSLLDFASASASWVEASRQSTGRNLDYQLTLLGHASEALSNATDVNMDDETALMLQLEKSYSAAAKLISTIDEMLKTLLNAV